MCQKQTTSLISLFDAMDSNNTKKPLVKTETTSPAPRSRHRLHAEVLMDNLPSNFGLIVPADYRPHSDNNQHIGSYHSDEPSPKKPRYNPNVANRKSSGEDSDSDYVYSDDTVNGKLVQRNVVNGNVINGNIVNGRISNRKFDNVSDRSCGSDEYAEKSNAKKSHGDDNNYSDISSEEDNNNFSGGLGVASRRRSTGNNKKRSKARKQPSVIKGGAVSKDVQEYDSDDVSIELKDNISLSQQKKYELLKLHKSLAEKVSKLNDKLREVQKSIFDYNEILFDWRFGIKDIMSSNNMPVSDKRYHKSKVIKKYKKRIVKESFNEVKLKSKISGIENDMKQIESKIAIIDSTLITDVTAYNINRN